MMGWFSKKVPKVLTDASINEVDDLKRQIECMKRKYDEAQEMIHKFQTATRSASFSFDFKAVPVFSVERNVGCDGMPVTVIGYTLPAIVEGKETYVVKEWYLNCDEANHERLVSEFQEVRNERQG
jgi:hypothetical protein